MKYGIVGASVICTLLTACGGGMSSSGSDASAASVDAVETASAVELEDDGMQSELAYRRRNRDRNTSTTTTSPAASTSASTSTTTAPSTVVATAAAPATTSTTAVTTPAPATVTSPAPVAAQTVAAPAAAAPTVAAAPTSASVSAAAALLASITDNSVRDFYGWGASGVAVTGVTTASISDAQGVRMALGQVDLKAYKTGALPQSLLDSLAAMGAALRAQGVKLVLQSSYDCSTSMSADTVVSQQSQIMAALGDGATGLAYAQGTKISAAQATLAPVAISQTVEFRYPRDAGKIFNSSLSSTVSAAVTSTCLISA